MPVLPASVSVEDSSNRTLVNTNTFDRTNGGVLIIPADSSFPGSPVAGEFFWRTDESRLYRRNSGNTTWEETGCVHGNEVHDPDMLTVGSARSDANLDILLAGTEDGNADTLHLHVLRNTDRAYLWDDFCARQLDDNLWHTVVNGADSYVDYRSFFQGGQLKLTSGAAAGRYARLTANGKRNWRTSDVTFSFRLKMAANADSTSLIKLTDNAGSENAVAWVRDTSGLWTARTILAGSNQDTSTGLASSINWRTFKIVCTGSSNAFYVDGVLKATHTTSLPDVAAEVYFDNVTTAGAAYKGLYIDWIEIDGVRETVT